MIDYLTPFPDLDRLTLGTMSLGASFDRTDAYVRTVRAAMDAGVPLHTSHNYNNGQSLNILKLAFREAPAQIPPLMAKIYCYNATQIRLDVEEILERLGVDAIDLAQLAKNDHRRREIVDDVLQQGPMFEALCDLTERGLVRHWVFEIFQKFSHDAVRAVADDLFASATFYFNILERETDDATWNLLTEKGRPIVAMRGLSGGLVDPANDDRAGNPGKPAEMPDRRRELQGLYERSGCASWAEFSLRFLYSHPQVRTVVVGTSRTDRFLSNLELARRGAPLASDVVQCVHAHLQKWAAGRVFDPNSPYR